MTEYLKRCKSTNHEEKEKKEQQEEQDEDEEYEYEEEVYRFLIAHATLKHTKQQYQPKREPVSWKTSSFNSSLLSGSVSMLATINKVW